MIVWVLLSPKHMNGPPPEVIGTECNEISIKSLAKRFKKWGCWDTSSPDTFLVAVPQRGGITHPKITHTINQSLNQINVSNYVSGDQSYSIRNNQSNNRPERKGVRI